MQVAEGAYEFGLSIFTQALHRHPSERANGGSHLFHVGVASVAEFEVGLYFISGSSAPSR